MKRFFSILGKLLGFVGKASAAWGQGVALLPIIADIIVLVQALKGQGSGADKRAVAIELFKHFLEAEGIIAKPLSPELAKALEQAIGECVDAGLALDKVMGLIKAQP